MRRSTRRRARSARNCRTSCRISSTARAAEAGDSVARSPGGGCRGWAPRCRRSSGERSMRRLWPALSLLVMAPAGAAQFYSLQVSHEGDRYLMSVDAHLAAPLAEVYAVITDYDHLTRIHAAILESRLVKHLDAHTDLVYSVHRGCVAFFCHSVK